jgi:glycosyltransferase involved in cell wall biosynthesis
MPEPKKRIVVASVLKPLNDTRMTEKIACSLANDPAYDVHVIGFPSAIPSDARITFHTFRAFKRLSFARWFSSARILRIMLKIKPTVIIVATHELLLSGVIAKILLGAKLVYDVQENYYLNIQHANAFPRLLKFFIAWYVRLKERILGGFISHYFIAEKIYANQMPFLHNRFTILENKALTSDSRPNATTGGVELIFSGTLSRSTGVFKAIELAKKLHADDNGISLRIIGYAALSRERNLLIEETRKFPFITLIGGNTLVNHAEVMNAVLHASAGIIAYEPTPATRGRIPTKLYEYLSTALPVIFVDPDQEWVHLAATVSAEFLVVTPGEHAGPVTLQWLKKARRRGTPHATLTWKNEESKLLNAISAL